MPTGNSILLLRVQYPLVINTFGKIVLCFLTKFKIFHRNLPHELVILFKFVTIGEMIVVKLHPSDVRIRRRADSERGHASSIDIQGAVGKEVEEKAIVGLLGVRNVLREIVLVLHGVESRRIVDGERWMSVLAVQTLLIPVHPDAVSDILIPE